VQAWRRSPGVAAPASDPYAPREANLSNTGLRTSRTAIITTGLTLLLIIAAPAARAAAAKGSSCAHPYRAGWEPNGGSKPSIGLNGIYGDKYAIKVSAKADERGGEVGFIDASWTPGKPDLKVCEARITFSFRKAYVSHHWQPEPLEFTYNPLRRTDKVTSFVITAAR
jgi:hypothetical protein